MGRQLALGGWGTLSGALEAAWQGHRPSSPGQADEDLQFLDLAQRRRGGTRGLIVVDGRHRADKHPSWKKPETGRVGNAAWLPPLNRASRVTGWVMAILSTSGWGQWGPGVEGDGQVMVTEGGGTGGPWVDSDRLGHGHTLHVWLRGLGPRYSSVPQFPHL